MPTVISESDLFDATVQRPNNGELADAASILLTAQKLVNRTRYLINRTQSRFFDVSLPKYAADVSGATDSRAKIQAALDDASGVCGDVFLSPGSYRVDDSLHMYPGVRLLGIPDASFLLGNHATHDLLVYDNGSSRKGMTEVQGIGFGSLIDTTGNAVNISHDLRLRFTNCTWNDPGSGGSPKLKGRFLLGQGTGTIVEYEDCWMSALGTDTALLLSSSGGELILTGRNKLFMPATYTGALVSIDDGLIESYGTTFDVTAHGGSANIIELLSLGYHVLKGNKFKGAFSSGSCITGFGGSSLSETDSVFDTVNAYNITGGALALGSELTLQNPIASTIGGSGTVNLTNGYRGQSLNLTNTFGGTGPLIVMPSILFIGQKYQLTIYNGSVSPWSAVTISGGRVSNVHLAQGFARTMSWTALDVQATGTPMWVPDHDWTAPAPTGATGGEFAP